MTVPASWYPRFQGFFLAQVQETAPGEVACTLTRYGQPVGQVRWSPTSPPEIEPETLKWEVLFWVALRFRSEDADGRLLFEELLACWHAEQATADHQVVRTRTSAPGEHPRSIYLPLTLSREALAQMADAPEYAPGLAQVYVPHIGWQLLPHHPHPQFQGFELLALNFSETTDRLDDFEAVLARDGQYAGTITHDLERQVLRFQLCAADQEAFLALAAQLDFPEDPIKGLFYAMAECLYYNTLVLTAQYVRTRSGEALPPHVE